MNDFLRRSLLPAAVFLTGGCILVIEVVAVRVLAPYFGSTIFAVSSVISVILAALSIGYYLGGRMSDDRPSLRTFFRIIMFSGIGVAFFHYIGSFVLPVLSGNLSLVTGPLMASMVLFFIPSLALGTLSPYAVKLQSMACPDQGIGKVTGTMFFWSTVGSIAGSLASGFFLVPHFGVNSIFFGTALILVLLGGIPLTFHGESKAGPSAALLAVIVISAMSEILYVTDHGKVVYSKDGVYERIVVRDVTEQGRPARVLRQDASSSSAAFLDTYDATDMVYEYTKYYAAYKAFIPGLKTALVIGGAAYSVPKALLQDSADVLVDVAEIEPSMRGIAERYFGLPRAERLRNFTEDGRRLLQRNDTRYDLIFGDAYHSLFSVPSHLTTREFFDLTKSRLNPGGVFMMNMIGDLAERPPSLIYSEIRTFLEVFPDARFFAVDSPYKSGPQNVMLVGQKAGVRAVASQTATAGSLVAALSEHEIDVSKLDLARYPVLTDDYSPVEYLSAHGLARAIKANE